MSVQNSNIDLDVRLRQLEDSIAEKDAQINRIMARCVEAERRVAAIETSTFWRATYPLRRITTGWPPGLRRAGRRAAKLAWWSLTLRLPSKLRQRQALVGQRMAARPRVLFVIDEPNWAYDISAQELVKLLEKEFEFEFEYVHGAPGTRSLHPGQYDLVYVFFWGETYQRRYGIDPERVIKEVSSHRWEDDPRFGPCKTADKLVEKYLSDAAGICCTSARLFQAVSPWHPQVFHTPNGFNPQVFFDRRGRTGPLKIGWTGDPSDEVKGLHDILLPACEGMIELKIAGGHLDRAAMNDFYNSIDVIAVASRHEGEPLPLIEGMATGCFPVSTDVGVAPELIRSGENGLVIKSRTSSEFRRVFQWCANNVAKVRRAGRRNASDMRKQRRWQVTAGGFSAAFRQILSNASRPRFRNDDVSADTVLDSFVEFCEVFWDAGRSQTHGITLFGRTNTHNYSLRENDLEGTEYEGYDSISRLPNSLIRELSKNYEFAYRDDLIKFIADSSDNVALHGLYHTDYSVMTAEEQRDDIIEGLRILRRLFPRKPIKYFVAPFNRTNPETYSVCADLGLTVLASGGVHLEENLRSIFFEPSVWYRYHHHRFYPQSAFRYHDLSVEALRECLARNARAGVCVDARASR